MKNLVNIRFFLSKRCIFKNLRRLLMIIILSQSTKIYAYRVLPANTSTTPPSPNALSAVSCDATCVIANTNNLQCSGDIVWTGLVASILSEDHQSSQSTISITISEDSAHFIAQKVVVFGANDEDVTSTGRQFRLHSSNNNSIPFDLHALYDPTNLHKKKDSIIKPGDSIIIISNNALLKSNNYDIQAENVFYGNILTNTPLIPDSYICTFVFKNYLGN